ncbi:pentatricopeptide repeat-containing protein At5g02860-like [Prosopis cineraria]|uniref:pentatricopeptide repeat-containing protein At5g02860-like n=1 Tax=Prosopis cineraria TaxID=364024 RepID=UPI00240FB0BD|nr:pentatricopeptide repeat-containing protein At5g02860-like [Prosopis cineraria]
MFRLSINQLIWAFFSSFQVSVLFGQKRNGLIFAARFSIPSRFSPFDEAAWRYPTLFYQSHMKTFFSSATSRGGRLDFAQDIFEFFLNEGYHLNVYSYSIMMNGLWKEGLFDESLTLLSKMKESGCLPNFVTFGMLIQALLRKNENDRATILLYEMIDRGLLQW